MGREDGGCRAYIKDGPGERWRAPKDFHIFINMQCRPHAASAGRQLHRVQAHDVRVRTKLQEYSRRVKAKFKHIWRTQKMFYVPAIQVPDDELHRRIHSVS